MNRHELYQKSKDVLLSAYFNETLYHGCFCACAVGNLISNATGEQVVFKNNAKRNHYLPNNTVMVIDKKFFKFSTDRKPQWHNVFQTSFGIQKLKWDYYEGAAKLEIDATGYSLKELAEIEYSFETCRIGLSENDHIFNGLVAVFKILDEIHEVETEFVKPTQCPILT